VREPEAVLARLDGFLGNHDRAALSLRSSEMRTPPHTIADAAKPMQRGMVQDEAGPTKDVSSPAAPTSRTRKRVRRSDGLMDFLGIMSAALLPFGGSLSWPQGDSYRRAPPSNRPARVLR